MSGENRENGRALRLFVEARQTKHNSLTEASLPKDEFAEILVRGDQQGISLVSPLQNHLVRYAGLRLGDVEHLEACSPQELHDGAIHALIAEQRHAASPGTE